MHESILIAYEVDELRGYPYMVLEYLEGRTLQAWMTARPRGEPEPPRRALEIVLPVERAFRPRRSRCASSIRIFSLITSS